MFDTIDPTFSIAGIIFLILMIAGWWRLFEKAGYSGILAIIPIVNVIVYCLISGRPWWMLILLLIPLVNLIALFMIHLGVAERFGQGLLFALGLMFLTPIFVLLLGFGNFQASKSKGAFA